MPKQDVLQSTRLSIDILYFLKSRYAQSSITSPLDNLVPICITKEWFPSTIQDFIAYRRQKILESLRQQPTDFCIYHSTYRAESTYSTAANIWQISKKILHRLIGEVLVQLHKLHEELGVVHTNIRSENTLVYQDNMGIFYARITRCELCKTKQQIQSCNLPLDPKDDVLAAGKMIFELITGFYPTKDKYYFMQAGNTGCMLEDDAFEHYSAYKYLLRDMLQEKREHRFNSTEALQEFHKIQLEDLCKITASSPKMTSG